MNECTCPLAGYCERRKTVVFPSHHKRCQSGDVDTLDRFYEAYEIDKQNPIWQPPIPHRAQPTTGYGVKLAEIIARESGHQIECGDCKAEIFRLNRMTAHQIRLERDAIATAIVARGKTKALKWWQRWGATLAPEIAKKTVLSWIDESIGQPKVAFISAAYMPMGGTETFHRTLIPFLKQSLNVVGFTSTGFHGGDGSLLEVPYSTGIAAAKKIVAECDVVVAWGIVNLSKILPKKRPHVIAVHHADKMSHWSNDNVLKQLEFTDEIVCVNPGTADHLQSCGKPVHYIPNAIDPRRIKPSGNQSSLRGQHGIPNSSKIVLFGHRMSTEKRPQLAIEIAKHLPPNWTMVIAGDGETFESVRKSAHGRVRIVGAVDSLADWLAVSDCFLSLSTFEGFGLSIAEAMAAGVPTVSTPTGIAPGLATTLPTDSTAAEWARAIAGAQRQVDPETILERFSVQRMVNAWVNVIRGTK